MKYESRKDTIKPLKKRIALIGFRFIGKSTLSGELSRRWEIPVLSMDDEIEKNQGASIADIVAANGWNYFRELELSFLEKIPPAMELILDAGGGVVEGKSGEKSIEKIDILKKKYFTIFIYLSEDKLKVRIKNAEKGKNSQRPGLFSPVTKVPLGVKDSLEHFLEIYRKRLEWYREAAHAVVDISDAGVRESADRIEHLLRKEKNNKKILKENK